MKASIASAQFQANGRFVRVAVLSLTIQNYSPETAYFTLNGIERELPAPQTVNGAPVPVSFRIEPVGFLYDVEIDIRFQNGSGNVIIDYAAEDKSSC